MDRPILFSAPMIRALMSGSKTMTRRVLKIDVPEGHRVDICHYVHTHWALWNDGGACACRAVRVPYLAGDRLWVREEYSGDYGFTGIPPRDWDQHEVWYWADGNPVDGDWTKPKPGMHMPRCTASPSGSSGPTG